MKQYSTEWLSLLENTLAKTNQLPSLEERFSFPWNEGIEQIKQALQLEEFFLSSPSISWKEVEQISEGYGKQPLVVSITMSPIGGQMFWMASQHDVALLCSYLLFSKFNPDEIANLSIQEGFYHFIVLKILKAIDQIPLFKDTAFTLNTTEVALIEKALCVDIECQFNSKILRGRLICPESFWKEFKNHYPLHKNALMTSNELDSTTVYLRPCLGSTTLSLEEWKNLKIGDFMVLDHCLYQYAEKKGSATFNLGETELIMARIKPEGIKVLDYIFHPNHVSKSDVNEVSEGEPHEIVLTAEFDPIPFTLRQLMNLAPGDSLPLFIATDQELNIVFKGTVKAKGSLLQLGETIGLRINMIESE